MEVPFLCDVKYPEGILEMLIYKKEKTDGNRSTACNLQSIADLK